MLPDYPNVKKTIAEWLNDFMARQSDVSMGEFSDIGHKVYFEGHAQRITREDGSVEESVFQHFTSEIEFDLTKVEEQTIGDLLTMAGNSAHDMARQKGEMIVKGFEKAASQAGNSVDVGGQPLSHDLILQLFKQIDIDFDQNGQPRMPTLIIGPDLEDRVRTLMTDTNNNVEQKQAMDDLIAQKRRQWNDRESSRKLVG